MFFKINAECHIGFKKLTAADLGIGTSHQPHIGLYEGVLNFLPDVDVVSTAMLICDGYCDIIKCYFDRIENLDGTFRSPKIRIGGSEESVVKRIREFASADTGADWYLLWFGLESEELVFILLNANSEDYHRLHSYISDNDKILDESHPAFAAILQYIEDKVNRVSVDLQKDLEVVAQTGRGVHEYKPKDIEKANKYFCQTGRAGEELINEYFDKECAAGHIKSYLWMNASRESGLPFDFIVSSDSSAALHVDVKSTQFDCNQPIVFSDGEIRFISEYGRDTYQVYRVFDMSNEQKKLCIYHEISSYADAILAKQNIFGAEISQLSTSVNLIKYAVRPNIFNVGQEIML